MNRQKECRKHSGFSLLELLATLVCLVVALMIFEHFLNRHTKSIVEISEAVTITIMRPRSGDNGISEKDWTTITTQTKPVHLILDRMRISDDELKRLSGMVNLKSLHLERIDGFTEAGLV